MNARGLATYGLFLLMLCVTEFQFAARALAQDAQTFPTPAAGSYAAIYGQGFGNGSDLDAAVGNLTFVLTKCDPTNSNVRSVSVQIEKPNFETGPIIDTILYRAAQYAWAQCPVEFYYFGGGPTGRFSYQIGEADIYLPDGTLAFQAQSLHGDVFLGPGRSYAWQFITDVVAQRRQAAANAQSAAAGSGWGSTWDTIADIFDLAVLFVIAYGLFALRNPVARWYYFNFHPHPATPMVERALIAGAVLDGPALARALGEVPPESSILASVRLEQGTRLIARMQEMSRAKLRELERHAAKDYERAAIVRVQEAIALAAVALEKAKAAFGASQSARRS
jgi:hypothetical protein